MDSPQPRLNIYVTSSMIPPQHEKHDTNSVFDKTKPDIDVIIVALSAMSELQLHSTVKPVWVGSHYDKRAPRYSQQEEFNIWTDTLSERAQKEPPTYMKPMHDLLHFPEHQIYIVISKKKVTSRLPLHI
jgi:hypothetical protein